MFSGTQAPEALAAPRHKVAMQKRRSKQRSTAKKASKTRAFAQPGADPRTALWQPPASPYGLIEEYLYDDPWKLLVACMLLNVTAGKQVWYGTSFCVLLPMHPWHIKTWHTRFFLMGSETLDDSMYAWYCKVCSVATGNQVWFCTTTV